MSSILARLIYDKSGLADITKTGIAAVHVPFPSYLALFAPTNAPDAPDLAAAVEHYCRSFLGLSASEIAAIRKQLCGRDGILPPRSG